jgi:hypothetical protein
MLVTPILFVLKMLLAMKPSLMLMKYCIPQMKESVNSGATVPNEAVDDAAVNVILDVNFAHTLITR